MNRYQARINPVSFFAQVVRVDYDGEEQVVDTFKSRHFASMKAAEKSTAVYIAKHHAA